MYTFTVLTYNYFFGQWPSSVNVFYWHKEIFSSFSAWIWFKVSQIITRKNYIDAYIVTSRGISMKELSYVAHVR